MLIKTKAIVISSIKFQEKSSIVKCFTQSDGLKSYFVQSAYSGKKSNQKIAYFQPLTILEIEANHKNKGTLEHFKEIKLAHRLSNHKYRYCKKHNSHFLIRNVTSQHPRRRKKRRFIYLSRIGFTLA